MQLLLKTSVHFTTPFRTAKWHKISIIVQSTHFAVEHMLEHFLRDGVVGHLSACGIEQEQGYREIHDLKNVRGAGGI